MSLRVSYFINQYPKVSHSFIRREILALERQGVEVQRIALRGWDDVLVDEQDKQERLHTRYVLENGPLPLLISLLRVMLVSPLPFFSALVLAIRMGLKSDRPLPYHLAYLAEACHMLPWLRAYGATHLHAHFGTNSAEVVMLAYALGGPKYSFTAHGSETVENARLAGLGEKVRRAAFVVSVCSFGRSQLYRWVDYAHWPKIHEVRCGLEQAFYGGAAVPLPDLPRLVCVGRLSKGKGQSLLIEAVYQLAQNATKFELVLAGDGEMRHEIETLIQRYGLTAQVRITGWISSEQVRAEILASRALILTSFSEGLPVVIMEAMALRRPVLTTCVGGIPELVRPGVDGWLFPAGSVDSIALAIEEALTKSTSELMKMGQAAYARVTERHSVDKEARKLVALFQQPIEQQVLT